MNIPTLAKARNLTDDDFNFKTFYAAWIVLLLGIIISALTTWLNITFFLLTFIILILRSVDWSVD